MTYSVGDSDTRPWGVWRVLAIGDGFVIKKIDLIPGARLSLQRHAHRSEHWTILHGSAEVILGTRTMRLGRDETVFIPAQTKHRIHNVGDAGLSLIEIQTGDFLDESDIERFDDAYGRI